MALQAVPLKDFRGGLNTRDSVADLNANESPELLNVTISSLVGQLEVRGGTTPIDTAPQLPNEKADYAKQVVIGATGRRFLMISIGGSVYAYEPNEVLKKLHAGTAGSIWDFEVYADAAGKEWVYMGNGVDEMKKWDGEAGASVNWTATKGAIPKGGVLCVWENRMFITYVGTQVQRLYFSEFADPEATIAEYGFVDIRGSEEDLDAIQDLAILGARLMVLKRRGVFFVSSAVSMLNRHIGGPGPWGRFMTAVLENKVWYWNPQGIFATSGVEVTMESGSIAPSFARIASTNQQLPENVRVIATKDDYPRLLVAIRGSSAGFGFNNKLSIPNNDTLIEMVPHINFRRIGGRRYLLLPAFLVHNIPADVLATWNPLGVKEHTVAISPGTGVNESAPILDTLARAVENPLSDAGKWSAWPWVVSAPQLIEELGRKEIAAKTASDAEGARWNVKTFSEPQVYMQYDSGGPHTAGDYFCLNINFSATERSGYVGRYEWTEPFGGKFTLERWDKGVKTILSEFGPLELPEAGAFALQMFGSKVLFWERRSSGGGEVWQVVCEATDSKYLSGYTGFELKSAKAKVATNGFRFFSAYEFPSFHEAYVERIFEIFSNTKSEQDYYKKPIEAFWRSSWIAIQEQEPRERLRRLDAQIKGDAKVSVFTDYDESTVKFEGELPKRGVLKEFDEPGATALYRFSRVRPETYGRYHQIMFSSVPAGKPFTIVSAELRVRGGKEH